jgi:hypothetical protein
MVDLLERVGHPERFGFQADMAHTLLYLLGYNAPEDAILPPTLIGATREKGRGAPEVTHALRPWTIDFHVAQNDATVHGTGSPRQDRSSLLAQRSQRQAGHRARRRVLVA